MGVVLPPRPIAFYHIWCGDERHGSAWQQPATEHFEALRAAKYDGRVMVGIVGSHECRQEVSAFLNAAWPKWAAGPVADEGYEMVTLESVHDICSVIEAHTPVMYAHTKGSFNREQGNFSTDQGVDKWRRAMTEGIVTQWRDRVEDLKEHDAVGLHWLTPEEFPEYIFNYGIFGGNFWWACAGYIAGLPPLEYSNRYCAEGWIGRDMPKVKDLKPGWPAYWS